MLVLNFISLWQWDALLCDPSQLQRIEKCAAQNGVTQNKETLRYPQAFGNILENLTELIGHRHQTHLQLCCGKSTKVNGNSVFMYNIIVSLCLFGGVLGAALWHHQPKKSHAPTSSWIIPLLFNPTGILYSQQIYPSIYLVFFYSPSFWLLFFLLNGGRLCRFMTLPDGHWGRYFVEVWTFLSLCLCHYFSLSMCQRCTWICHVPKKWIGWDDLIDAHYLVIYSWLFPGVY